MSPLLRTAKPKYHMYVMPSGPTTIPPARSKKQVTTTDKTTTRSTRPMLGLPYIQGLSEQLSRAYQSHGVYLFHKPSNTIRSMLVHPKDKSPKEKLCGTIYHITCDDDTHQIALPPPPTMSERDVKCDFSLIK